MSKKAIRFLLGVAALGLWISLVAMSWSDASVRLKKVQVVQNGAHPEVSLIFDGKIKLGQYRADFFRDVVQVTLTDAQIHPAKITHLSGGKVSKLFAYQFGPKVVRARFTVSERGRL